MKTLKFTKMHGLGNDFMVIDGINQTFEPKEAPLSAWSDRFRGVGFDQLLLVERPSSELVDFRYRIFNADGGEVGQCGNGARCFVRFVTDKGLTDKKEILVETAGGVIVPMLCEYYALEGISDLIATVRKIRQAVNPDLDITGIVRTMYDSRSRLVAEVSEQLRSHFGDLLFETVIPRNIRLAEAPSHGMPVMAYDAQAKGTKAYLALADELMARVSEK